MVMLDRANIMTYLVKSSKCAVLSVYFLPRKSIFFPLVHGIVSQMKGHSTR